MTLQIYHKKAFDAATKLWEWVNFNNPRSFVMITDHLKCGKDWSLEPCVVSNARHDEKKLVVTLNARKTWKHANTWSTPAHKSTWKQSSGPGCWTVSSHFYQVTPYISNLKFSTGPDSSRDLNNGGPDSYRAAHQIFFIEQYNAGIAKGRAAVLDYAQKVTKLNGFADLVQPLKDDIEKKLAIEAEVVKLCLPTNFVYPTA